MAQSSQRFSAFRDEWQQMLTHMRAINALLRRQRQRLEAEEQALLGTPISVTPHLAALSWIKQGTGLADERVAALVGVSRQTLHRWRQNEPITVSNRQRLFAVRDVLERAAFRRPTVEELGAWLDTPTAEDGRTPADFLAAGDIDHARLLAVATPSATARVLPAWITPSVKASSRASSERQEALPPWYEKDPPENDDDARDVFVPLEMDT